MKPIFIPVILTTLGGNLYGQPLTISTIAGGAAAPVPTPSASIGLPAGVAADASGNLYFIAQAAVFKVDWSGGPDADRRVEPLRIFRDGGPAVNANSTGRLLWPPTGQGTSISPKPEAISARSRQ